MLLRAVDNAHELWPASSTDVAHADVDALWEELRFAWESRGQGGIELVDALEAINDLLDRGVIQPEQFREMLVRARAHANPVVPAARTKSRASKGGGTAAGRAGRGRGAAGGGGGGAAGRGGARGRGSWQAVRSAVGGGGRSRLIERALSGYTSLSLAAAARPSCLARLAPLALGAEARTPV